MLRHGRQVKEAAQFTDDVMQGMADKLGINVMAPPWAAQAAQATNQATTKGNRGEIIWLININNG